MKLPASDLHNAGWLLNESWCALNQAVNAASSGLALGHLGTSLNHIDAAARLLYQISANDLHGRDLIRFLVQRSTGDSVECKDLLLPIEAVMEIDGGQSALQPTITRRSSKEQDDILVNRAIPSIWQLIRMLQWEVKKRGPWWTGWAEMGRVVMVLLLVLAAGKVLTLAQPEGVIVIYYRGIQLRRVAGIGQEFDLYKEYKGIPIALRGEGRKWSASWHGCIRAPHEGVYVISTQNRGGLRFWLDDTLLVDNWIEQDWQSSRRSDKVFLTKGPHRFRMHHFDRTGTGAVRVRWSGSGIPENTVIGRPFLSKY